MRAASTLVVIFLLLAVATVGAALGEEQLPERTIIDPEAVVGAPLGPPLSGEELDRRTDNLSATMRCPVCQALSVNDSPTASALAMKEEIRDLLAAGYTESQVLEYFETSYGEFILLAPKRAGLNWLVWVSPLVVLLLGIGLIARRARSRPSEVVAPTQSEDDDLSEWAERVREEIGQ